MNAETIARVGLTGVLGYSAYVLVSAKRPVIGSALAIVALYAAYNTYQLRNTSAP